MFSGFAPSNQMATKSATWQDAQHRSTVVAHRAVELLALHAAGEVDIAGVMALMITRPTAPQVAWSY